MENKKLKQQACTIGDLHGDQSSALIEINPGRESRASVGGIDPVQQVRPGSPPHLQLCRVEVTLKPPEYECTDFTSHFRRIGGVSPRWRKYVLSRTF